MNSKGLGNVLKQVTQCFLKAEIIPRGVVFHLGLDGVLVALRERFGNDSGENGLGYCTSCKISKAP